MKLNKLKTIDLNMKPCSMASFINQNNKTLYAIACYEQNVQNEYVGEIVIADSSDLSTIKTIPAAGGVFRIYDFPEENMIYAFTTSGSFMFINAETLNVDVLNHPEKPYFTDGRVTSTMLAATDDKGNLHIIDRLTQQPLSTTKAHCLRKVGSIECPAWSCSWMDSNSLVTCGDDGRICLWDLRQSNLKEVLHIDGVTEDGIVFVNKKVDNVIVAGDYGQNYCIYDLKNVTSPLVHRKNFPGGVWHVDSRLEASRNLCAAACMQGGVIVFNSSNSDIEIIAANDESSLTYGVAIHEEEEGSIIVVEVEFDGRKLNKYSLV